MNPSKRLFFLGLIPPQEVSDSIRKIQESFSQTYDSYAALKSPPHITLQPPFEWKLEDLLRLQESLNEFMLTRRSIPIKLSGFAAFAPRVIYVNVIKNPELLEFYHDLQIYLEKNLGIGDPQAQKRPFAPHITVAYKDLTKPNFRLAWSQFKEQPFVANFEVNHLTLLIHQDKKWHIQGTIDNGLRTIDNELGTIDNNQ